MRSTLKDWFFPIWTNFDFESFSGTFDFSLLIDFSSFLPIRFRTSVILRFFSKIKVLKNMVLKITISLFPLKTGFVLSHAWVIIIINIMFNSILILIFLFFRFSLFEKLNFEKKNIFENLESGPPMIPWIIIFLNARAQVRYPGLPLFIQGEFVLKAEMDLTWGKLPARASYIDY